MVPVRVYGRQSGLLIVPLLAALMVGCGPDDDEGGDVADAPPQSNSASPSAGRDDEVSCDAALSPHAAEELAGGELEDPRELPFESIAGCRWDAAEGATWIQVIDVQAAEWATILPAAMGQVLDSGIPVEGREKLEKGLALIEEGAELDGDVACEMFTTMVVSIQGAPAGSTEIINYLPDADEPQAINAQRCRDGRYRSVQLTDDSLEPGDKLDRRIKEALEASD